MPVTDQLRFPVVQEVVDAEIIDLIVNRLRGERAVQVVGHLRPDGDCIGSLLAMHHLLDQWARPHALAARQIPQSGYDALPGFERIKQAPDPELDPSVIVYVDCASLERGIPQWTPPAPIINIDHHASNTLYGEINWVEPKISSVGEMLYWLTARSGSDLTAESAEAMLIAMTTDTGSFRFSNTSAQQHYVAAHLIEAGASPEGVARMAFGSQSPQSSRLIGHVLNTMELRCAGKLAWSELRKDDYIRFGGDQYMPENLPDTLRSIRGVQLGLLFHEIPDGSLRLNLRSDGTVNVSVLAGEWGGGGHPCAAGLTLRPTQYERDRDQILARAAQLTDGAADA